MVIQSVNASEKAIAIRLEAQGEQLSQNAHKQKEQLALLQDQQFEACRRRLLNALSFPEMKDRQNMIENRVSNFGDTYGWIFGEISGPEMSGSHPEPISFHSDAKAGYLSSTAPENNFVEWFANRRGPYWISGKPGSGKSSIMDYIYHGLQSETNCSSMLQQWAGSKVVGRITHWFFRPATTPLLKNLQGFWRSLCFQVLELDLALPTIIREDADNCAPKSLKSCLEPDGSCAESWTDADLATWFNYLIEHSGLMYFLLVDGLDEIDKGREQLLSAIMTMSARHKNLKLCCSSRPESPFLDRLSACSSIKLQDLNFWDIKEDCYRALSGTRAETLYQDIAYRADGVFLWAHIVAEDLVEAANRGEDEEDLQLRLNDCPEDMGELFDHMLKRLDKFYARHPKPYLRFIEFATRYEVSTLLDLRMATLPPSRRPNWNAMHGKFDDSYLRYLNDQLDGFWQRIENACAGLVQRTFFNQSLDDSHSGEMDSCFPNLERAAATSVSFIHTSVLDFFQENESARKHLDLSNLSDEEVAFALCQGTVAESFFRHELNIWLKRWLQEVGNPCSRAMAYLEGVEDVGSRVPMLTVVGSLLHRTALGEAVDDHLSIFEKAAIELIPPQLSIQEYLILTWSLRNQSFDMTASYIEQTSTPRRGHMAGFALSFIFSRLCNWSAEARKSFDEVHEHENSSILWRYTDVSSLRLVYGNGFHDNRASVSSTVPLIHHLGCFGFDPGMDDRSRPSWEHLVPLLRISGSAPVIEGWYLGNWNWLVPVPDTDCPYMMHEFLHDRVLVVQLWLEDIDSPVLPVQFVRWKSRGMTTFVHLDKEFQRRFRVPHTRKSLLQLLWEDFRIELRRSFEAALHAMAPGEAERIYKHEPALTSERVDAIDRFINQMLDIRSLSTFRPMICGLETLQQHINPTEWKNSEQESEDDRK